MRKSILAGLALSAAATIVLTTAVGASAAPSTPPGVDDPTRWHQLPDQLFSLGSTQIDGCTINEPFSPALTLPQSSVPAANESEFTFPEPWQAEVYDIKSSDEGDYGTGIWHEWQGVGLDASLAGKTLVGGMWSDAFDVTEDGKFITVSAEVYSQENTGTDEVSIGGAAVLLNTGTCEQTLIHQWQGIDYDYYTESVAIPSQGTYRIVMLDSFRTYSIDLSPCDTVNMCTGGIYSGYWTSAATWVYKAQVSSFAVGDLGLDLALDATTGDIVPGGTVILMGGGLQANSPYTLELHSDPVMIDLNGALTDADGNFYLPVQLPDPIEPGIHSLTLAGITPAGDPISDILWFEIDADGKLLWAQGGSPKLADTGVDSAAVAGFGLGAVALLALGGVLVAVRRRNA